MAFTRQEKRELDNLPTIGYWSALGGVEVKKVEYGIEDYIVCISNAWGGKKAYHRVRIKYTHAKDSREYIDIEGTKLYLDQGVKCR